MKSYPKTRAEARKQESRYYYTGKPCVNGHDSKRITGSGHCQGCNVLNTRRRLDNNPEYKRKFDERNLARHHKKKKIDPAYVERRREYGREYGSQPHIVEKKKIYARERGQKKEVVFRRRENARTWRINNPQAAREKLLKRHHYRLLATPLWFNKGHQNQFNAMRMRAMRMTRQTGTIHHVDHIVPLCNPIVCGLHVPWNWQILTEQDNIAKGNTFEEDAGYDSRATGRCQG